MSCGAGHIEQDRTLARRIVGLVAYRRSTTGKPWKGPLPKRRVSPKLCLGDIRVRRRRRREDWPGGGQYGSEPKATFSVLGPMEWSAVGLNVAQKMLRSAVILFSQRACVVGFKTGKQRGLAIYSAPFKRNPRSVEGKSREASVSIGDTMFQGYGGGASCGR